MWAFTSGHNTLSVQMSILEGVFSHSSLCTLIFPLKRIFAESLELNSVVQITHLGVITNWRSVRFKLDDDQRCSPPRPDPSPTITPSASRPLSPTSLSGNNYPRELGRIPSSCFSCHLITRLNTSTAGNWEIRSVKNAHTHARAHRLAGAHTRGHTLAQFERDSCASGVQMR